MHTFLVADGAHGIFVLAHAHVCVFNVFAALAAFLMGATLVSDTVCNDLMTSLAAQRFAEQAGTATAK